MDAEFKKKLKTAGNWALNILFVLFFLLCLFALFCTVAAKRDQNGAIRLFGHEMFVVVSASMEQCDETDVSGYEIKDIPTRSLVWVETVPDEEAAAEEWYAGLRVGDVLTFRYVYVTQETITHRIVEITPKETGGYIIVLEGDNKNAEGGALQQTIDTSLADSPNYVIGKVTWKSLPLGLLITALRSPWGIVCIVIIPCLIIIALEVVRIVGVVSSKKQEKQAEERKKKDDEIAELKRQLAAANAAAEGCSPGASGAVRQSPSAEENAEDADKQTDECSDEQNDKEV